MPERRMSEIMREGGSLDNIRVDSSEYYNSGAFLWLCESQFRDTTSNLGDFKAVR